MKIFYTKKDRELVEELKVGIEVHKQLILNYDSAMKSYRNYIIQEESKIDELKSKLRKMYGRNGGLTKQNNKLKSEKEELLKQIEDLQSDRYLKVDVPSKIRKHKQTMQYYVSNSKSQIIKKVKNENE